MCQTDTSIETRDSTDPFRPCHSSGNHVEGAPLVTIRGEDLSGYFGGAFLMITRRDFEVGCEFRDSVPPYIEASELASERSIIHDHRGVPFISIS